ncbi:MAG: beta/gamma crystallin family protein [Alphaproteobacteria bacterium]|nr:beta/gamma crystallin family protein [Alphaproteobacteria bacterium]
MYKHAIPSLLLLLTLTAPAALADNQYEDPAGRFSVSVPEGWLAGKPSDTKIAALLFKPITPEIPAVCAVVVTASPLSASVSQADLDAAVSKEMTKEFWEATFKALGGQDIVVGDVGSREQRGRNIQYAGVEFTTKAPDGKLIRLKLREEIHPIPGIVHEIACTTQADSYELASADFTTVFASYTPKSGLIAQAPSAPAPRDASVVTLYANAGFDGTARVVAGDTPNVTALGWSGQTGSLAVSGFGEWQVCEGVNYAGKCMAIVGAHAAPANGTLRIGSLRPLVSQSSVRGTASLVSTNAGRLVGEALKNFKNR